MDDVDRSPPPPTGPPTAVEQWLCTLAGLRRLNAAMFARVAEHTGLPESSLQVLGFLLRQPEHRAPMSRLARQLEYSTAGITKVTDRLAQAGLLERHSCPADRRVVYAALTAEGVLVARRGIDVLAEAIGEVVIARTGADDFVRLAEIVAKAKAGSETGC